MFNAITSITDKVGIVVSSPSGAPTLLAGLIAASFFLGAVAWQLPRQLRTALHVGGSMTVLIAVILGVHSQSWVTTVNTSIIRWLASHRHPGLDVAARDLTFLANPTTLAAAGVTIATLLSWQAHSLVPGVVVIATPGLASVACSALNDLLKPAMIDADSSMPAGQVACATALVGVATAGLAMGRSRVRRYVLAAGAVSGVLIIAVADIYTGACLPTDVIAGAAVGSAFMAIGAAALQGSFATPVRIRTVLTRLLSTTAVEMQRRLTRHASVLSQNSGVSRGLVNLACKSPGRGAKLGKELHRLGRRVCSSRSTAVWGYMSAHLCPIRLLRSR